MANSLGAHGVGIGLFGSNFAKESLGRGVSQFQSKGSWSGGDWYPLSALNLPTLVRNIPSLVSRGRMIQDYDVVISELGSAWQAIWFKSFNRVPILLDEHNVEWHLMRQLQVSSGNPHPWERLRTYERVCHRIFDHITVVSNVDKHSFEAEGTPSHKITTVPNGVDTGEFRPDATAREQLRSEYGVQNDCPLLMYMGSFKFFPNVDAINTILRTIFPQAKELIPNLRLMVIGPGSESIPLGGTPDIISPGVVERSVLPSYINCADICIAPLRFGSGTRFKILEWMACGKAVIATRRAAEGIDVTHGKDIILEDDTSKYPVLVSNIWKDGELNAAIGRNARTLVEENYSWEKCIAPLERSLRTL